MFWVFWTFRSNVLLPFLGLLNLGLLTDELIRKENVGVLFECLTEFKRNWPKCQSNQLN
jgi:hypothetical protein